MAVLAFALYFFVFLFGTIIGSFLNVIILRYGTGQSIFRGRSRCFSCGKVLHWHELIPLISFVLQKGRCRDCRSRISWQYPVVELITGLLFLLVFSFVYPQLSFQFPVLNFHLIFQIFFLWLLFALLVIIAVYDLRQMIIPNKIVWLFNSIAFISLFNSSSFRVQIYNFLAGISFFSFFAFLWLVSKGRWMGFGDAKLALGLGWLLGPAKTMAAFIFSFWLGLIVSLFLLIFSKGKFTIKSRIPFAPFLITAFILAYFIKINFSIFL